MQFIDAPENPMRAISEGRLRVSNLEELRRMEESIAISPGKVEEINQRGEEIYADTGEGVKTSNIIAFYIQALVDLMEPSPDWKTEFLITLINTDDNVLYNYRLRVADGEVSDFSATKQAISEEEAACEIVTDVGTFINLLRYMKSKALGEITDELSDQELELVAGGKNNCGGEACAAEACGSDSCGGEACAADLCLAVGCGADSCGADGCAVAGCGANLCAADACSADACVVDVIPVIPFI